MGFFRPEVETALKVIGIAGLITVIVLPVAWGYEQRKQARLLQARLACRHGRSQHQREAVLAGVGAAGASRFSVFTA